MDPLSLTASVTAIFQLANAMIRILCQVKQAPESHRQILAEVSAVTGLLASIRVDAEDKLKNAGTLSPLAYLNEPHGPLPQLQLVLTQLKERFKPAGPLKKACRAVMWPLTSDETSSILERIERQKTLLILALANDHFDVSRCMRDEVATIRDEVEHVYRSVMQLETSHHNRSRDWERREVLAWLSPLSFHAIHADIFSCWKKGTGRWLFESVAFQSWLEGRISVLWCPGAPGSGKTILASTIINHLEQCFQSEIGTVVAYVYCNYKESSHTCSNILASIFEQIVRRKPSISSDLSATYRRHLERKTRPTLAELSELLRKEVDQVDAVYIVVDAVDECSETEGLHGFLPELLALRPKTRLLVTSRPLKSMEDEFKNFELLKIAAAAEDVEVYTATRIDESQMLRRHVRADPTLKPLIIKSVIEKAQGMFLLAQLHLDSLSLQDNRRGVRRALEQLPTEINQTYDKALNRILSQEESKAHRAKQVLSWICHTARPLTVEEIRHALAVEPNDHDLFEDALPDEHYLIDSCAGLVVIDRERSVMRLVHYSAQQYLDTMRTTHLSSAEVYITRTCLTYLNFTEFGRGCCGADKKLEARLEKYRLLEYAACYWGRHAGGSLEEDEGTKELIERFLSDMDRVASAVQVQHILPYRFEGYTQHYPKNLTGLHLACAFGLRHIAEGLISSGSDIEAPDGAGMTCLHRAAFNGHEHVVDMLLDQQAKVEAVDLVGMTSLHWAASMGHASTLQLLLRRGARVDAKTNDGETALYHAASNGQVDEMKILLGMGADPNAAESRYGHTAISKAAWIGNVEAVRLLIQYGADVMSRDTQYGQSSLSRAAENGHDQVVELLLATAGVDPDCPDNDGRTPLNHAARRGREKVVRMLVKTGRVDPNAMDRQSMTPIQQAGEKGFDTMLDFLESSCTSKDTNTQNLTSPPPQIMQAVQEDSLASVAKLLEEDITHLNTRSRHGETPLILAAKLGRYEIVKLLLSHNGINYELRCQFGRTALLWASGNGHASVAKLLLQSGADVNSTSQSGKAALHWAAEQGQEAVVELLLGHERIDIDAQGWQWGETALHRAAELGLEGIVKKLLDKGADPRIRTNRGCTALELATYEGYPRTEQILKARLAGTTTELQD